MARIGCAEELRGALNGLSPEDSWGDKADVHKMFLDGFTSLKHLTTVRPDLLQGYGIPAVQTGTLQQLAKEAIAEGKGFCCVSLYRRWPLSFFLVLARCRTKQLCLTVMLLLLASGSTCIASTGCPAVSWPVSVGLDATDILQVSPVLHAGRLLRCYVECRTCSVCHQEPI